MVPNIAGRRFRGRDTSVLVTRAERRKRQDSIVLSKSRWMLEKGQAMHEWPGDGDEWPCLCSTILFVMAYIYASLAAAQTAPPY